MGSAPTPQPETIRSRADVDALLNRLTRFGIKLGLDIPVHLLAELGNPQSAYPSIHVGGSNGKGSTVLLADALLSGMGLTVGRYTSPHLVDLSERITISGVPIADRELIHWAGKVAALAAGMEAPSTFFEAVTAMALAHFAGRDGRPPVDVAVVEVGMGGRLDATNVITPKVSVITNISLEHTEYLGGTIMQVAAEKAGIIKSGVPVVTGASGPALSIIRERAQEVGAPLYVLGSDFDVVGGEIFSYHGIRTNYAGLSLGLAGAYQRANAALALAATELFFPKGVSVAESVVTTTLADARWPGRLEVARNTPRVVLDAAHNAAAARALAGYLDSRRQDGPLHLVLGVLADKDLDEISARLMRFAEQVIITAPQSPRSADPAAQAEEISGRHPRISAVPKVTDAVDTAIRDAQADGGWVLVAGSIYTVGEARSHLLGKGASG